MIHAVFTTSHIQDDMYILFDTVMLCFSQHYDEHLGFIKAEIS
jgi:hypothetical protein